MTSSTAQNKPLNTPLSWKRKRSKRNDEGMGITCPHGEHMLTAVMPSTPSSERHREGPEGHSGTHGACGWQCRRASVRGCWVADPEAHRATAYDCQGPEELYSQQPPRLVGARAFPSICRRPRCCPDQQPRRAQLLPVRPSPQGRRRWQVPPSCLMSLPRGRLWEVPDQPRTEKAGWKVVSAIAKACCLGKRK